MFSPVRFICAGLLVILLMPDAVAAGERGVALFVPPGSGAGENNVARLASRGSLDEALQELKSLTAASQSADTRCRALILKLQIDDTQDETDKAIADLEAAWKTGKMDAELISWALIRVHHYCHGPVVVAMCDRLATDKDPRRSANAYFVRGRMAANEGHYAEAMKNYEEAMARNKSGTSAYLEGGAIYVRCGKYEQAVAALTHALEIFRKSKAGRQEISALESRARAYLLLKKYPLALADYNEAIKRAPLIRELFLGRAEVYKAMGQKARADADLAQVRVIDNGY